MPEQLYEGSIVQECKDALEDWLNDLKAFDMKDEAQLKYEVAEGMEEDGNLDEDYEEALDEHLGEFKEIVYPG